MESCTRDPNAPMRAALRRLHEQATPGEVKISQTKDGNAVLYVATPYTSDGATVLFEADWATKTDARLYAALRNALPALLDEIDACRRWIGRQTKDRPFCYRCEVLDAAGAGNCRCEIAANE